MILKRILQDYQLTILHSAALAMFQYSLFTKFTYFLKHTLIDIYNQSVPLLMVLKTLEFNSNT